MMTIESHSRLVQPRIHNAHDRARQRKFLEEEKELLRIVKRTNTNSSLQTTDNDVFSTTSSSMCIKSKASSDTQPSDERFKRNTSVPTKKDPPLLLGSPSLMPPVQAPPSRPRSKDDKPRKEPLWRRRLIRFGGSRKNTLSSKQEEEEKQQQQGALDEGQSNIDTARIPTSTPMTEDCSTDSSTLSSKHSDASEKHAIKKGRSSIQKLFRKQRKAPLVSEGVDKPDNVDLIRPMTLYMDSLQIAGVPDREEQDDASEELSDTLLLHRGSLDSSAVPLNTGSRDQILSDEYGSRQEQSRSGRKRRSTRKQLEEKSSGLLGRTYNMVDTSAKKWGRRANSNIYGMEDELMGKVPSESSRRGVGSGGLSEYSSADKDASGFSLRTPSLSTANTDSTLLSSMDQLYKVTQVDVGDDDTELCHADEGTTMGQAEEETVMDDDLEGERIIGRRSFSSVDDDEDDDDDDDGCHAAFREDLLLIQSFLTMCRAPCVSNRGPRGRRLSVAQSGDSTLMSYREDGTSFSCETE